MLEFQNITKRFPGVIANQDVSLTVRAGSFHAVIGELQWRLKNHRAAAESFRRALRLAHVGPEQLYLTRMLERSADIAPTEAA